MSATQLVTQSSGPSNIFAAAAGTTGYTVTADGILMPVLELTGLNGAAATFTIWVDYYDGSTTWTQKYSIAKPTNADTAFSTVGALNTFFALSNSSSGFVSMRVQSSNANDTAVTIRERWIDRNSIDVGFWRSSAPTALSVGRVPALVGAITAGVITNAAFTAGAIDAAAIATDAIGAAEIAAGAAAEIANKSPWP